MVKYQQLVSSIVVQDPDIESFYSSTGGNFFGPSGASGRMMVNTKPRQQRNVYRRRDGQPAAAQTRQHSRTARFPLGAAGDSRGRPHVQERVRLHAVRAGHRSSSTPKRRNWSASWRACPACRMSPATCRSRRRASISCSTAIAPPPCTSTGNTISSTLYDAFGPQFASTIYAPTNQYRVLLEMLPRLPAAHRRAGHDLPEERHRRDGAAQCGGRSS